MITACLADNMFPDQKYVTVYLNLAHSDFPISIIISPKLRRVLRKSLSISSKTFTHKKLLHEIVPIVVEILGDTYPEMQRNLSQIFQIIDHEDGLLQSLLKNNSSELGKILEQNPGFDGNDLLDYAGFVPAFKEVRAVHHENNTISGELMFKLRDTYGLGDEIIEKIAEIECLTLDRKGFAECVADKIKQTKSLFTDLSDVSISFDLKSTHLKPTDSAPKYSYEYNEITKEFKVPSIKAKIVAIKSDTNGMFAVIVDKTNFYNASGGQAADLGRIVHQNGEFHVKYVSSVDGLVVHSGKFVEGTFEPNDLVELIVDGSLRTGNIRNHTATHLLNASVKQVTKCVTYQKSSNVTSSGLKLVLGMLGYKLEHRSIAEIQKLVRLVKQLTFDP